MNKHKRKRVTLEYLNRCIDGAAEHANRNSVEISKLQDRIKALEIITPGQIHQSGQPCGCDPGAKHVCEWHSAQTPQSIIERIDRIEANLNGFINIVRGIQAAEQARRDEE